MIRFRGECAVRHRSHIHQVIGIVFGEGDQRVDDLFRLEPIVVIKLESPGAVEGAGGFHHQIHFPVPHPVIAQPDEVLAAVTDPAVDETLRLKFFDQIPQFPAVFCLLCDGCIEPELPDRTVVRQQFCDLRNDFVAEEDLKIFLIGMGKVPVVPPTHTSHIFFMGIAGIAAVFFVPVQILGVVDPQFDAVFFAGVLQFFQRVAPELRMLHNAVIRVRRVIHAEAVVVLGCEHDILDPGGSSFAHPFICIKLFRVEGGGDLCVFFVGDPEVGLCPFPDFRHHFPLVASAQNGISSPMNEHAELPCLKLFHNIHDFLSFPVDGILYAPICRKSRDIFMKDCGPDMKKITRSDAGSGPPPVLPDRA